MGAAAQMSLIEWLNASAEARAAARSACLARIAEHDPLTKAWVQVRPDATHVEGPLAGIPFGCKDIIETAGLATEYGSPIYRGRLGTSDAAIVGRLRELGAVLMGKTQTTAFAWKTPSVTRNPRSPAHTPGGSSSGSAAAVALGEVPFALGTQTLGSIIRPASFCGVTGFKPTYGTLSMEGVLPCAPSLDTLGLFTQTAAEMVELWGRLQPATTTSSLGAAGLSPPAIGYIDPLPPVEPAMAAEFSDTIGRLRASGFDVRPMPLGIRLGTAGAAARTILAVEAARVHAERYREHGDRLLDMADLVREGLAMPVGRYEDAQRAIAQTKAWAAEVFAQTPVVLTPAACGPAPAGLESTGDPAMNAPWTALGTPAVTIPMPVSGLPLGLQMTAAPGQDAVLLAAATAVELAIANR